MRIVTIVVAASSALFAACSSDGSGVSAKHARYEPGSVPGLVIELRELVDGEVYRHAPDAALPDRKQEVDTRSTLRLTFDVPPDEQALRASPEWARIENTLTELQNLLTEYRAISAEVARLPETEFEGTAAFQERVGKFANMQQRFTNALVGTVKAPGLVARGELLPMMRQEGGLWRGFQVRLESELAALEQRAREFTAKEDEVLVTVRARLEPEVGPPQWLQVPGYWESNGDEPADVENSSSAELRKLRAEFAAAKDVAAMIDELRATGSLVLSDLGGLLDAARADVEKRWRELVLRRKELLDQLLAGAPADDAAISDDERAFWTALAAWRAQFDESETRWRSLFDAAKDGTLVERLDEVLAALAGAKEELERLGGLAADVASKLAPALTAMAESETKTLLASVRADLGERWKLGVDALLAKLPATAKALEDLKPFFSQGNQVLAGVDGLPKDVGSAIPHPPADLPDIDLDLTRQPITPGDRLALEIAFFDRGEYEAAEVAGKSAKPREVVAYTNDAIKSGWIWSGDVLFVRSFDGADHFESTAAVSYERHWRDRDDPRSWLNRLDPGLGFHAAALNLDPNETAEFGVGVNGSLFGGLLRAGVGYDVSIDADQEYWYFGFGLISALQQVKDLGENAFSD
jgi:hypothetical protein